ncbi:flagellar export protein FliJ [Helicobacter pylori]|nr:flagellar export protein FliJ [Helicobacter pylori]WRC70337.1 flagellar export protein FliJ [Helicobacter pylori]
MRKILLMGLILQALFSEEAVQELLQCSAIFESKKAELKDDLRQLSAFKNPELGGMSLFLQTQQLKSALRTEIEHYQQEGENLNKDLKILEKEYLLANQELEKAKIILENEKRKEKKIVEKKEQALLDENAMILHWQKEGLHA